MDTRYLLITEIVSAKIELPNGDLDAQYFRITNDIKPLVKEFGIQNFIQPLGLLTANSLKLSNACAYKCGTFKPEDKIEDRKVLNEIVSKFHNAVNSWLAAMWFWKDHSATAMRSFLIMDGYPNIGTSSQNGGLYSSSGGTIKKLILNQANIFFGIYMLKESFDTKKYGMPDFSNMIRDVDITPSDIARSEYNSMNRISRSFLFLNNARLACLLPQKIMSYISTLECLFTTTDRNTCFKVSNRAAHYIGGDEKVIGENQVLIKNAYGIRSKFVHGQELRNNKTLNEMIQICTDIDQCIRKIFVKIISQDSAIFMRPNRNSQPKKGEVTKEGFETYLQKLFYVDPKRFSKQ